MLLADFLTVLEKQVNDYLLHMARKFPGNLLEDSFTLG